MSEGSLGTLGWKLVIDESELLSSLRSAMARMREEISSRSLVAPVVFTTAGAGGAGGAGPTTFAGVQGGMPGAGVNLSPIGGFTANVPSVHSLAAGTGAPASAFIPAITAAVERRAYIANTAAEALAAAGGLSGQNLQTAKQVVRGALRAGDALAGRLDLELERGQYRQQRAADISESKERDYNLRQLTRGEGGFAEGMGAASTRQGRTQNIQDRREQDYDMRRRITSGEDFLSGIGAASTRQAGRAARFEARERAYNIAHPDDFVDTSGYGYGAGSGGGGQSRMDFGGGGGGGGGLPFGMVPGRGFLNWHAGIRRGLFGAIFGLSEANRMQRALAKGELETILAGSQTEQLQAQVTGISTASSGLMMGALSGIAGMFGRGPEQFIQDSSVTLARSGAYDKLLAAQATGRLNLRTLGIAQAGGSSESMAIALSRGQYAIESQRINSEQMIRESTLLALQQPAVKGDTGRFGYSPVKEGTFEQIDAAKALLAKSKQDQTNLGMTNAIVEAGFAKDAGIRRRKYQYAATLSTMALTHPDFDVQMMQVNQDQYEALQANPEDAGVINSAADAMRSGMTRARDITTMAAVRSGMATRRLESAARAGAASIARTQPGTVQRALAENESNRQQALGGDIGVGPFSPFDPLGVHAAQGRFGINQQFITQAGDIREMERRRVYAESRGDTSRTSEMSSLIDVMGRTSPGTLRRELAMAERSAAAATMEAETRSGMRLDHDSPKEVARLGREQALISRGLASQEEEINTADRKERYLTRLGLSGQYEGYMAQLANPNGNPLGGQAINFATQGQIRTQQFLDKEQGNEAVSSALNTITGLNVMKQEFFRGFRGQQIDLSSTDVKNTANQADPAATLKIIDAKIEQFMELVRSIMSGD